MVETLKNLFIPRYHNNFYPLLLRKPVLAVFTLVILGVNILASGAGGRVFAGSISSAELVALTNQERAAGGLVQLQEDQRLIAAAYAKAQNMFDLQYWAHYGPNGESPWQFITASGYGYVYAGENLAKGFSSSAAVHSAWMASQTHRDNIMNGNYRDIGIAVVPGVLAGEEVVLVVQMFGSLTAEVPAFVPPSGGTTAGSVPQGPSNPPTVSEPLPTVTIEYPTEALAIADNEFLMKGTVTGAIDSVVVVDNEARSGGVVPENGAWDYRPDSSWSEGTHEVVVSDEEEQASAKVNFVVDTTAPVVDESSISIVTDPEVDDILSISLIVDNTAKEVVLRSGEFSVALAPGEDGIFRITMPKDDIPDLNSVTLSATDELGNTSEIDVSDSVLGALDVQESGGERNGLIQPGDLSRLITRVAILLIAILLVIDVVYLARLRIVHTRGKTLFPLALWIILMGIAMVVGTGGSIL